MKSKYQIHLNAFHNKIDELWDNMRSLEDLEATKVQGAVYHGVRSAIARESKECDPDEGLNHFNLVIGLIGTLTPVQIQEIFPISKEYDGERYESKDYFTTKALVDNLPPDSSIAETMDPFEFLFDYQNAALRTFLVKYMCAMSSIRKSQGGKGIMEEYFEEQGVTPHYLKKDAQGKDYVFEPKTGKTYPVSSPKPRRPKWIRVVR